MFFVVTGWVIFRSDSLQGAFSYFKKMFTLCRTPYGDALFISNIKEHFLALVTAPIFALPLWDKIKDKKIFTFIFEVIVFILSVTYIVKGGYNVFIYFNF